MELDETSDGGRDKVEARPGSWKEAVVPVGVDAFETELCELNGSTVLAYGSRGPIEEGVRTLNAGTCLASSVGANLTGFSHYLYGLSTNSS